MLESLQRVTDAALAQLSQEDLLGELLRRITEILDADTAAILLLEQGGTMLRARAANGIEEEVRRGVRIPVGRGFAGRIAAERSAITIDDVDHADILNPILREKGIQSLLGVPLLVDDRVIGVLHVGTLTRREFTPEDADLLQLAADRAALAIERTELYAQRRLAEVLQRRLLPEDLPTIPGLQMASAYLPASGESLGGDWYDAFELGGGRIVLAVGDVVGHGPAAAAVMAQLRAALRAYAVEDHPAATRRRAREHADVAARSDGDDDARVRRPGSRRGDAGGGQRRAPAPAHHRPRRRGHLPPAPGLDAARSGDAWRSTAVKRSRSSQGRLSCSTPTGSSSAVAASIDDGLEQLRMLVEHAGDVDAARVGDHRGHGARADGRTTSP